MTKRVFTLFSVLRIEKTLGSAKFYLSCDPKIGFHGPRTKKNVLWTISILYPGIYLYGL